MSGQQKHDYHLVDPSPWPLFGAFSGLLFATGGLLFMHGKPTGHFVLPVGFAAVLFTMFVWWRDVIKEGKHGDHKSLVRHGLRLGMSLFILSEIMFFFAFFWSFFKASLAPEFVLRVLIFLNLVPR